MVGTYRCGTEEAETSGFRNQKIQVYTATTSKSGHSSMHTLCLTAAILSRFGTVRRPLYVLMNRTIKAIKRLLYGEEILTFDRLSIFQDMLLIFKIRNGLLKYNFVLTLLVDVTRKQGGFLC
jgi:hypothetical protein